MRLHDGRYQCALCRAILDVPLVDDPQVVVVAASGEPNIRTLVFEGKEIHRCAYGAVEADDTKLAGT
jgi:hypothetical protein